MAPQLNTQRAPGVGHMYKRSAALSGRGPRAAPLGAPRPSPAPQRRVITPAFADGLGSGFPQQPKAVFTHRELPPTLIDNVEIVDARDALEACSGLDGSAKDACYCLFGCDPEGVEQYLTVVEALERSIQSEPDAWENCWRIK